MSVCPSIGGTPLPNPLKSAQLWFTAPELAERIGGKFGLPKDRNDVRRYLQPYQSAGRQRPCSKALEYPITVLPDQAKQYLLKQMGVSFETTKRRDPVTYEPHREALGDAQRQVADARQVVLTKIEDLVGCGISQEVALRQIVQRAADPQLSGPERAQFALANKKSGGQKRAPGQLSVRTLKRWLALKQAGGIDALAPRSHARKFVVPGWAHTLLDHWQQPQKPSLRRAHEMLQEQYGRQAPSYEAVKRITRKVGVIDLQRGRMLPRELKNIRPFVRRSTDGFGPGDIYVADGHQFDAEVAHLGHGRPFRPEITAIIDVATRRIVGWSAGLAESQEAVADALRNACESAICAIFYHDRGPGYIGAQIGDPITGLIARLGISDQKSIAYNSQARGVIERSHRSIWVKAAKDLPTYIGAAMDPEAKNKVYKLTRQDVKMSGTSRLLMPWQQFVDYVEASAASYNNRPHSSLSRVFDASLGKLRHMTPNEAWAEGLTEIEAQGESLPIITPEQAVDLFRPCVEATVARSEVRCNGNIYFSRELEQWHGDMVRVHYDIHDPARVWVRDGDGRLISVAELDGNKRPYFPKSVVEQAREKRAQGREKRLQVKLDEVAAELRPGITHNVEPSMAQDLIDASIKRLQAERAAMDHASTVIQLPASREQKVGRWMELHARAQAGGAFTPADASYYRMYYTAKSFVAWREETGFDETPVDILPVESPPESEEGAAANV